MIRQAIVVVVVGLAIGLALAYVFSLLGGQA